jgi:hypothetical protein
MANDPRKNPDPDENLRRLLSTPPKPHKNGAVKKPLTESGEKKQGDRPAKRSRPADS